jgi:hypothetical protein
LKKIIDLNSIESANLDTVDSLVVWDVASGTTRRLQLEDAAEFFGANATSNSFVESASMVGDVLTLGRNGVLSDVTVDLSQFLDNTDVHVASGAMSGSNLTLTMNDASTVVVDLSSLIEDTFVASGAVAGTDLTLTMNDASTVVIDVTSLVDNNEVASGAVVGTDITLTMSDASEVDVDISSILDRRTASGAIAGTDITFTRDDASTFDVDVSSVQLSSGAIAAGNIALTFADAGVINVDIQSVQLSTAALTNSDDDLTLTFADGGTVVADVSALKDPNPAVATTTGGTHTVSAWNSGVVIVDNSSQAVAVTLPTITGSASIGDRLEIWFIGEAETNNVTFLVGNASDAINGVTNATATFDAGFPRGAYYRTFALVTASGEVFIHDADTVA